MANIFKRKVKKLTDLRLKEISGVDHPASLHEGWAVMKSSDNELEQALGEAIQETDDNLMEKTVETETTEAEVDAVEESVTLIEGDTVSKELADVRKELADAKAEVEKMRESSEVEKATRDAQRWAIVPQLDPEEFAPVLRSLRAADAEATTEVEKILDENPSIDRVSFYDDSYKNVSQMVKFIKAYNTREKRGIDYDIALVNPKGKLVRPKGFRS